MDSDQVGGKKDSDQVGGKKNSDQVGGKEDSGQVGGEENSGQVGGEEDPVLKIIANTDLIEIAGHCVGELNKVRKQSKTEEEKFNKQVRLLKGKLGEYVRKYVDLKNYVTTLEREARHSGKELMNRQQKITALESRLAVLRAAPKKNRSTQTETDTNMHDFLKEIENEKEATLECQTLLRQNSEIVAGMTEQMKEIESSDADATTKNKKLVKSFFDMFEKIKATDEILARQQEAVQRQQEAVQRQQEAVQRQQEAVQKQQDAVQRQLEFAKANMMSQ